MDEEPMSMADLFGPPSTAGETSDVKITDVVSDWEAFLKRRYNKKELVELAKEFPHKRSIYIDYQNLEAFGKRGLEMADDLIEKPDKVYGDVRDALVRLGTIPPTEKSKVNVRFTDMPRKKPIRLIRETDIGTFVAIEGAIRKVTEVRPRVTQAVFRCVMCGARISLPQMDNVFHEPDLCPSCGKKKFEFIPRHSTFVDSQKVRIQEFQEGLRGGEYPQTLDVEVSDDIVGLLNAGDRVVLNGILRTRQRKVGGTTSTLFDIFMDLNSVEIGEKGFDEVEITAEDEEVIQTLSEDPDIYNKMIKSIAPGIWGHEGVKIAIVLQLFGGIAKVLPDGSNLRGDIHILLMGDPGVAKSQILRYVTRISPRAIFTSGRSTTSAGLTATAVKDEFGDGRWTLEAGALVLADMGVAAVDEMDKMTKEDRSALHEAMEQQQISVAKAGILANLKSRCALLGAANPKLGRFDPFAPYADQINMPPSLLSRFDLIFILTDNPSPTHDQQVSDHIIRVHTIGEIQAQKDHGITTKVHSEEALAEMMATATPAIEPTLLRKYIAYAKRTTFPVITEMARTRLTDFYMDLRRQGVTPDSPLPVTARQQEALVRLAEASARVRLSQVVTQEDAERVIQIVMTSLMQVAYDHETGKLDIDKVMGTPQKIRKLNDAIRTAIRTYGDESGVIKKEVLIDTLVAEGSTKDAIEDMIEKMSRSGELMQPRPSLVKLL